MKKDKLENSNKLEKRNKSLILPENLISTTSRRITNLLYIYIYRLPFCIHTITSETCRDLQVDKP